MRKVDEKYILKEAGVLLIVMVMVLSTIIVTVNAKNMQPPEVWVDDDGPDDGYDHFDTIQEGIDAVAVNGKVHVYAGNYPENIVVNKVLNEIIGENGPSNTFIEATSSDDVVTINKAVSFSGFTIACDIKYPVWSIGISIYRGSVWGNTVFGFDCGILAVESSREVEIYDNDVYDNRKVGICLGAFELGNYDNKIYNNNVHDNDEWGIILSGGDGTSRLNEVYDNIVSNNGIGGIYLDYTAIENKIYGNTITQNTDYNIKIENYAEPGNEIYGNEISDSDYGILLENSIKNKIYDNGISGNKKHGILFKSSNYNEIYENDINANDECGIFFSISNNNVILSNIIADNGVNVLSNGGIRLDHSNHNTVNNNIISRNMRGGILNWLSDYNKIYCNVIGSNHAQPHVTSPYFGIAGKGSYNEIFNNDIINNLDYGIHWECPGNMGNVVYCNNLVNHEHNAVDWSTHSPKNKWNGNFWSDFQSNSGYPLCYNLYGGSGIHKDNSPLVHPCDHSTSCNTSGLILDKTADCSQVPLGGQIEYTIYYENQNPYTVHNVVIIDYLPLNCHYIDAPTGTYHPYPEHWVIWEIGDLSPQKSGSVTLIVSVGDDVPEEIHNEVVMTSDETHAVWAYIDISSYDPGNNPFPPDVIGVTNGTKGEEYSYTIVSTDPNGDDVYYYVEWGDSQVEDWFGPYPSGETATVSYTWEEQGTYTIRAKAKDTNDLESEWASLEVNMPKNKAVHNPLFFRFLEHHPHMFLLLRFLLGL